MRRKRCKLIRDFFNDVYKTNSGRAIHGQHPLEYEQVHYANSHWHKYLFIHLFLCHLILLPI